MDKGHENILRDRSYENARIRIIYGRRKERNGRLDNLDYRFWLILERIAFILY